MLDSLQTKPKSELTTAIQIANTYTLCGVRVIL
jgi:hypothetical protein